MGHEHHSHVHHHHHHHGGEMFAGNRKQTRVYWISIVLNLAFVGVEALMGFIGDSLGLLADAGHNLGDVFSLLLALIAVRLSATHGTKRFTYGYRKSSVLISLLNAIILLVAVGGIIVESIRRLSETSDVTDSFNNGSLISWTAGIGIIINGLTAWMLSRGQKDINQRGAYLHMLADTLVSVGVVLSGLVISITGWNVVDPLVSIAIAGIILWSTWGLLSESVRMSIDAVPEGISTDEVSKDICDIDGVMDVHHIHIWAISTNEIAMTAHVMIGNKDRMEKIVKDVKEKVRKRGIRHSTIEVETEISGCEEREC